MNSKSGSRWPSPIVEDKDSIADPDPGSCAFLTPGSRMGFFGSWVKSSIILVNWPKRGGGKNICQTFFTWIQQHQLKRRRKRICRTFFQCFYQCSESMTFWGGSGSGSSDPCFWLVDPDPPIVVIDLQIIFNTIFFWLLLFEGTFTSFLKDCHKIEWMKIFLTIFAWW